MKKTPHSKKGKAMLALLAAAGITPLAGCQGTANNGDDGSTMAVDSVRQEVATDTVPANMPAKAPADSVAAADSALTEPPANTRRARKIQKASKESARPIRRKPMPAYKPMPAPEPIRCLYGPPPPPR